MAIRELYCLHVNQVGTNLSANLDKLAARLAAREFAFAPVMA